MRVECVNLVDPSQHHCVSVFILARRCRPVRRGVFVIINVLFFFPPAQQVPTGGGGRGKEMSGGGWEGYISGDGRVFIELCGSDKTRERIIMHGQVQLFWVMPSRRRRGIRRLVPFLESVLLLGTAAQSRVVDDVSRCIFCVRSLKNGLVIRRQVPIQYAIGPGSIGRSADKPENGVEKFLGVKSLRFYAHITIILWSTTRGPFRNCTPAFRYSLLGTVAVHHESVAVWDIGHVTSARHKNLTVVAL